MSYDGKLLVIGQLNITKYIAFNSYKITPNQRQDEDSYRDANFLLHRNVLEHTPSKIEWNSPPMTNRQISFFNKLLKDNYLDYLQRKITATYYDPETDSYKKGVFYMPDAQYTIKFVKENEILYDPIRYALIEY